MQFNYNKVKNNLGEVQQTLHWYVTFSKHIDDEKIQTRVTTASTPVAEITHTQVAVGGFTLNYPGKVNKNGTITVTIVEGTDALVLEKLNKWAQEYWSTLGGNDTKGTQKKADYLYFDTTMSLLGPDDVVTQTYLLKDCMLSFDNGGDFGQDAEAMSPSVTIAYNDFHWGKGGSTTNW